MPSMDFTAVLAAPEFQDKFYVQSISRVVGLDGVEVDKPSLSRQGRGVVIPGKMSLNRMADGSRVTAYIEIYTRQHLTAGHKKDDIQSQDADVIKWHGRLYVVMSVEDYGAFGSGFYKASCDLLTLSSPN
jgi:hypothetical protein